MEEVHYSSKKAIVTSSSRKSQHAFQLSKKYIYVAWDIECLITRQTFLRPLANVILHFLLEIYTKVVELIRNGIRSNYLSHRVA